MSARTCGECQLCCRLLPVRAVDKPANQRCQYQKFKVGCRIYAQRPLECALWSCRWLAEPDATAGMQRPDRAHYVIDMMPDFITATDNDTGEAQDIPVLQVWVDPDFRDAHRDPALRAYLAQHAIEHGTAVIVRFNSRDAITLFPPAISSDGLWLEITDNTLIEQDPERMTKLMKINFGNST